MNKNYITLLLRIGLGVVLLYFGFLNISQPQTYGSYVPEIITNYLDSNYIMLLNGIAEIILGLMLLGGLYRVVVSVLVGLHILGIAVLMFPVAMEIAARDFGLSIAAFALAMMQEDSYSLDQKWRNK